MKTDTLSAIPYLPFTRPSIDEATIAAVGDVLRSGWLTTGPRCAEFEAALSQRFCGRPVRLAASATAALEMALRLAGIGPGDEVITTPLSWVATANVILSVGATPVFVDIERGSRNIDLSQIERAITSRTRALMPVDLAGLPVDRTRLYEVAQRHRLRVIEDAAQSVGTRFNGKEVGSFGDLVAISFHANKNITSAEGGCLVMNTAEEARTFEKLRLQGVTREANGSIDVDRLGGKANLTDVAAAIGLGQLARLDAFTARRRELAKRYFDRWPRHLGFELPLPEFENSNWHMFQPLLPLHRLRMSRIEFVQAMHHLGIGVGVHYPPIHLFSLYRALGHHEGEFPEAERVGASTVTLPLFPTMADADIDRVCVAVQRVIEPVLKL